MSASPEIYYQRPPMMQAKISNFFKKLLRSDKNGILPAVIDKKLSIAKS
jgi:hypothetical protein